MKRFFILLAVLTLLLFVGCTAQNSSGAGSSAPSGQREQTAPDDEKGEEATLMYITVNENKLKVSLAQNSTVEALIERLKKGDITLTATENGGFEIYGSIGASLPTNNEQIAAQAGDVLFWAGNNICIFFGSNSYSYTRIGKIEGYAAQQLKSLLGAERGSVQVKISLQ